MQTLENGFSCSKRTKKDSGKRRFPLKSSLSSDTLNSLTSLAQFFYDFQLLFVSYVVQVFQPPLEIFEHQQFFFLKCFVFKRIQNEKSSLFECINSLHKQINLIKVLICNFSTRIIKRGRTESVNLFLRKFFLWELKLKIVVRVSPKVPNYPLLFIKVWLSAVGLQVSL